MILLWGLAYSSIGSLTLHEDIKGLKDMYRQIGMPLKGDHLWYLEELFCLNIFNPLIYAYIKNKKQVNILLLVLIFSVFTLSIVVFKIPFNLHPFSLWGSWALIYYILGFWAVHYDIALKLPKKRYFGYLFVVFTSMQILYNYLILDKSKNDFFNTGDLVPDSYQSPFVILSTLSLIVYINSKKMISNRFINYIGNNSLGLYLFQGIVIRILYEYFNGRFVFPIIVFVACFLLVLVFNSNKYTAYFVNLKTITTSNYDI